MPKIGIIESAIIELFYYSIIMLFSFDYSL